jgi:hypothetical protein
MLRGGAGEQRGLEGILRDLRPRNDSLRLMQGDYLGDSVSLRLLVFAVHFTGIQRAR